MIASFLKSPGLFSVFWPFSEMLLFGCSPLVCQLPTPPIPLIILYLLYQKHLSQLIELSPLCSIDFFQFPCKVEELIFLSTCFQFYSVVNWTAKSTILQIFFFVLDYYYYVLSSGRDYVIRLYVKVSWEFMCHFLGQLLGCAYAICPYGQI